jgi:uncharacterized membrane protein YgcG
LKDVVVIVVVEVVAVEALVGRYEYLTVFFSQLNLFKLGGGRGGASRGGGRGGGRGGFGKMK